MAKFILQGILIVVGLVSLSAAVFNWNWFFNADNAQFSIKALGRQRARICYGLAGVLMILVALFMVR